MTAATGPHLVNFPTPAGYYSIGVYATTVDPMSTKAQAGAATGKAGALPFGPYPGEKTARRRFLLVDCPDLLDQCAPESDQQIESCWAWRKGCLCLGVHSARVIGGFP